MKIRLIKAKTFVLDPNKTYLIAMDADIVTQEDAYTMLIKLKLKNAVVGLFRGDPNNVIKIIEQPEEKKRGSSRKR